MKIKVKVLFILAAALLMFTTASAYTGISGHIHAGSIGDDRGPWIYGGTIYAYKCGTAKVFIEAGTTFAAAADGNFEVLWNKTTPQDGDSVCVIISYNDGGSGTPPDSTPPTFQQDTTINDVYPYSEFIYTGTGPNAIVLQDLTAASPGANPWLAAFIVVGALALVSGGMAALRKSRK